MKDLYTISEFAKLRNVTSESLRHYDRIGLLKPAYVDPETSYRYYSILQYEKLGTIRELRQLGVPLDVIKDYLENRNVQKSLDILNESYEEVTRRKNELEKLQSVLQSKIKYLKQALLPREEMKPEIFEVGDRMIVTSGNEVREEGEMGYEWTLLEKRLKEPSPILATSRIGEMVKFQQDKAFHELKKIPFIFSSSATKTTEHLIQIIPGGTYVDIFAHSFQNEDKAYQILLEFIAKEKYQMTGDIICFFPIDLTITEEEGESAFEMQVRIQ